MGREVSSRTSERKEEHTEEDRGRKNTQRRKEVAKMGDSCWPFEQRDQSTELEPADFRPESGNRHLSSVSRATWRRGRGAKMLIPDAESKVNRRFTGTPFACT